MQLHGTDATCIQQTQLAAILLTSVFLCDSLLYGYTKRRKPYPLPVRTRPSKGELNGHGPLSVSFQYGCLGSGLV